jgi:hypothetical protein
LSGFSCPTQIPGCAAKRCTVRTLGNQEIHICLRCQAGYTAVKGADGMSTVQCGESAWPGTADCLVYRLLQVTV